MVHPKIAVTDKFYGVQALSPHKAVVVGYGGKILMTQDGGRSWQEKPSGTELALYDVQFVDERTGWISGQGGLLLHTADGGESWQRREAVTDLSLFSLFFLDKNHGWAVGDKAVYLRTTSGGESWEVHHIEPSLEGIGEDVALAVVDPIIYDVYFVSEQVGWMVGEFGKIYHTADGGLTWQEQQNSLVGQGGVLSAFELPTFFGVHFANAREGVAVGLEGKIAWTENGGQNWNFVPGDPLVFLPDPLYGVELAPGGERWAVGAAGQVLRFEGGKWEKVDLGIRVFTWLRAVDFWDEKHGWIVGGYGMILRTEDGGRTWLPCLG